MLFRILLLGFLLVLGCDSKPNSMTALSTSAVHDIAILTVRKGNVRGSITMELLPLARRVNGTYLPVTIPDPDTQGETDCTTFDERDSGLKTATDYGVYFQGRLLGRARSGSHRVAVYACSGLCVMSAQSDLKLPAGARFDQTIIQQLIAVSPPNSGGIFETSLPSTKQTNIDQVASQFAKSKLFDRGEETPVPIRMKQVQAFRSSLGKNDTHVFLCAVGEGPGDRLRMLTAVIPATSSTDKQPMFFMLQEGDIDRWAPYYDFLDALDIDGDGLSEIVAIYNNYEYHQFQILKFTGHSYEVFLKGPEYGC